MVGTHRSIGIMFMAGVDWGPAAPVSPGRGDDLFPYEKIPS